MLICFKYQEKLSFLNERKEISEDYDQGKKYLDMY